MVGLLDALVSQEGYQLQPGFWVILKIILSNEIQIGTSLLNTSTVSSAILFVGMCLRIFMLCFK